MTAHRSPAAPLHLYTSAPWLICTVAALVQEVVGRDVGVQHGPPRQGDICKNYSGIRKVMQMLGWRPEVDLGSGLRETWAWFESQGSQVAKIAQIT